MVGTVMVAAEVEGSKWNRKAPRSVRIVSGSLSIRFRVVPRVLLLRAYQQLLTLSCGSAINPKVCVWKLAKRLLLPIRRQRSQKLAQRVHPPE